MKMRRSPASIFHGGPSCCHLRRSYRTAKARSAAVYGGAYRMSLAPAPDMTPGVPLAVSSSHRGGGAQAALVSLCHMML